MEEIDSATEGCRRVDHAGTHGSALRDCVIVWMQSCSQSGDGDFLGVVVFKAHSKGSERASLYCLYCLEKLVGADEYGSHALARKLMDPTIDMTDWAIRLAGRRSSDLTQRSVDMADHSAASVSSQAVDTDLKESIIDRAQRIRKVKYEDLGCRSPGLKRAEEGRTRIVQAQRSRFKFSTRGDEDSNVIDVVAALSENNILQIVKVCETARTLPGSSGPQPLSAVRTRWRSLSVAEAGRNVEVDFAGVTAVDLKGQDVEEFPCVEQIPAPQHGRPRLVLFEPGVLRQEGPNDDCRLRRRAYGRRAVTHYTASFALIRAFVRKNKSTSSMIANDMDADVSQKAVQSRVIAPSAAVFEK